MRTWDDGKEIDYWRNCNGIGLGGDGIGGTPYVIDVQNKEDRYPLKQLAATPPTAIETAH